MLDIEAKIKTIKGIDSVQIMYMDGDICKYGDVESVTIDLDKEMFFLELGLGSYNAITVYNICNIVGFSVILKNENETNDLSDTKIFSILDQK